MADNKQDGQPVLPTRGLMRQLTRYADGYGGGPPRGGVRSPYPNWNPGAQRAASTSAIGGGTFHEPGSGSARLFYKTADGWTKDDQDVTVMNDLTPSDIEANTVLRLDWIAGEWWVAEAACKPEDSSIVTEDPPAEPED